MADARPNRTPYTVHVPVRIRDIDFAGHAHHSAALLYFEEARAAYWRDVVQAGDGLAAFGFVLAEVRVRYRARIRYPGSVAVTVRVVTLGRKHFDMAYEVRSDGGEVVLTGSTTQVMYDYDREASIEIPAAVRAGIEAREGPFGPADPGAL